MPVWEDVHSRRFYEILVLLIVQSEVVSFSTSDGSSPHTRVYVWGGHWVSNQRDSGLCDLVLVYRFLSKDRWTFSGWCGGYPKWDTSMIPWHVSHLLWSAICQKLWKDSEDPGGACCLSPLYTRDWRFSKSRLLAIFGLPWPRTLSPTNEAIRHKTSGKKDLIRQGKKWPTWWDVT